MFVTGATGFVGSWLVKELVRNGAHVIALVRDEARECMLRSECLPVSVAHGSLANPDSLVRVLAEHSVRTIFHLAAQPLVAVAQADPAGTLEVNVRGTWNLLDAARRTGVSHVVVASSQKAYGCPTQLPYTEQNPLAGEFPYDVSKSCADLVSAMYAKAYGMGVAIARCANLFGGGDLNFSRTIPGIIQSTLNNERFTIRSDGRSVRDFLYVEDSARAYLLLAEKLAENPAVSGRSYNFSLETPITVLEMVARVLRLMGRSDLQPVIRNQTTAEVGAQYMACDRARHELGWAPQFTLDEGLEKTIVWYSRHFARQADRAARDYGLQPGSNTSEEYAQPATHSLSGGSAL